MTLKLDVYNVYASTANIIQIMTLCWPYITPRLNLSLGFCMGKRKSYALLETIAAICLKFGLSIQLNELMNLS